MGAVLAGIRQTVGEVSATVALAPARRKGQIPRPSIMRIVRRLRKAIASVALGKPTLLALTRTLRMKR
jgi:hypothetical protein